MGDPIELLESRLPGRVGRPGSSASAEARRVFCPAARQRRPAAVIVPRGSADVAEAMRWAGEVGERLSIRSGGHSFDGFSIPDAGVLLDLQGLTAVEVRDRNRVALGPGARVKAVALELADRGLAVPIGNCPSVGIGGLASGGGFGFLTRGLGLTCDSLVEATVVTAAGEVVRCSAESDPELFWATRGGGGSAGVVTEFVIEAAAVESVAGATLRFEWEAAAEVVARFCEVLAAAPDTLDLKLALRTTGPGRYIDTMLDGPPGSIPGTPFVEIEGQLLGPLDEALRDARAAARSGDRAHPRGRGGLLPRRGAAGDPRGGRRRPGAADPPAGPGAERLCPRVSRSRAGRDDRRFRRPAPGRPGAQRRRPGDRALRWGGPRAAGGRHRVRSPRHPLALRVGALRALRPRPGRPRAPPAGAGGAARRPWRSPDRRPLHQLLRARRSAPSPSGERTWRDLPGSSTTSTLAG